MASFTRLAIVCLVLCVLGQAWAATGAVDGWFSKEDRKELIDVLYSQQQKDGSFGSLENTYEAVGALVSLKGEFKHKDDLCKYAANSLRDAKSAESVFYAVSIAENLNCGSALTKATATILNQAVAASDLHANYFAISAAYTLHLHKHLSSDFDKSALPAAVKRIAQLAGSEGRFAAVSGGQESSYHSALAFQATALAAALTDIDKETISEIADEVSNLLEAERLSDRGTGSLAFEDETGVESALETTAEVIEGIDALVRLTGKPLGLTGEHIVDLAQYFVNLDDDLSDPEAIHALASALNFLAASTVHQPISLTLADEAISVANKEQLRVTVTDIFGKSIGKPKVTIVRARSRTEESPIANQAMTASGETDFVYEFLASKPDQGLYAIEFRVAPGADSVVRVVRVVSTATIADATLSVSDSKNPDDANAEVRKFVLESSKKATEVVKAGANAHLHVFFRLKNPAGRSSAASQVAVRLVNQKTKEEEVFDGVQTLKGYRVHIDVAAAAAAELNYASGLYKAELIVADADLASPVQWHFADLQLQFPAQNASDEQLLKPKKEIHHQFRPAAARGSDAISRIFTLLVVSPWGLLLVGLLVLGANIGRFPTSGLEPINALAFVATIGAIFFLLYVYWLRLNMFQTLYYLALLTVPAVFFGSRALRHLHNAGNKQKRE